MAPAALARGCLLVDVDRLRAALDALVENAVEYSEPQTAIELRAVYEGGGQVSIEVQDEGGGVPDAALERIFDRFGRADSARTRTSGGVGLGLAIVDAIAKAHGGSCTVRRTSAGSLFALHVPHFTPRAPRRSRSALTMKALSAHPTMPSHDQRGVVR
jgi:two-component system, OmpR family, sensor kinase